MELKELAQLVKQQRHFEVRVIGHAGSRYYQLELEDAQGALHDVTQRGKPITFRALSDVYTALKRVGIRRAYLMHQVAHDEVIGREANYQTPLSSCIPLVF